MRLRITINLGSNDYPGLQAKDGDEIDVANQALGQRLIAKGHAVLIEEPLEIESKPAGEAADVAVVREPESRPLKRFVRKSIEEKNNG